jgi:hypothetical protein
MCMKKIILAVVLAACTGETPAQPSQPPLVEWPVTWDVVDVRTQQKGAMMTGEDHDRLWQQVGDLQAWAHECAAR